MEILSLPDVLFGQESPSQPIRTCIVQYLYKWIPSVENNNNVAVSMHADDSNVTVWLDSVQLAVNKLSDIIKI
jgi:predicted transcriptional regulator with HTH domain